VGKITTELKGGIGERVATDLGGVTDKGTDVGKQGVPGVGDLGGVAIENDLDRETDVVDDGTKDDRGTIVEETSVGDQFKSSKEGEEKGKVDLLDTIPQYGNCFS
jgi:hypothetical protein